MIDGADLIFMPYNYVVSENITNSAYVKEGDQTKLMKDVFKKAVLLIDEAHNIVASCEDTHGVKINTE